MSRNRITTECECGVRLATEDAHESELMTDAEYGKRSPSKVRYGNNSGYGWARDNAEVRFREVACPLCGANYAVWYVKNLMRLLYWSPFDSSYFRAFNDEPAEEDEPTRAVTMLDVAREYVERHGQARGVSKPETAAAPTIERG